MMEFRRDYVAKDERRKNKMELVSPAWSMTLTTKDSMLCTKTRPLAEYGLIVPAKTVAKKSVPVSAQHERESNLGDKAW